MKRILLTGSSGRLGSELVQNLSNKYELITPSRSKLPLSSQTDFYHFLKNCSPEAVIHSGAISDVDYCELHQDEAFETNVLASKNLAKACQELGIRLIHISSDYVFNGEKGSSYTEYDEIGGSLNFYGQTKEKAETVILQGNPEAVLLRVAWLYGKKGNDFVSSILNKLTTAGAAIQVVDNQYGSPTSINDLCKYISLFLEHSELSGPFHLVNQGSVSRLKMAQVIADEFEASCEITGISSENFLRPAKRPKNTSLISLRMEKEGLPLMPDWEESLRKFVREKKKALGPNPEGYF